MKKGFAFIIIAILTLCISACGTVKVYNVTYVTNSDELAISSDTYSEKNHLTLPEPKREGYTFSGWYEKYDFSGNKITSTKGGSGDKTYYAKWDPVVYSIVYDANGGTGTIPNSTHTYDTEANLSKNTYIKEGCVFSGWATSASGDVVYSDEQSIKNLIAENEKTITLYAVWKSAPLEVVVNGYNGVYDGNSHSITVIAPEDVTISYSADNKTYGPDAPVFTDAGSYTVYYKAEKEGEEAVTGSESVVISKAPGSLTLSSTSGTITFASTNEITVTSPVKGVLTAVFSDKNIAFADINENIITIKPGNTAGSATITIKVAESTNYTEATATYTVTVKNSTLTIEAKSYNGKYDGKAHSITVICEGAKISYATSENGEYSESKPLYTKVGTYTVFYKVEKSGADTVTGSETVTISKADSKITLSDTNAAITYPDKGQITIESNLSGGKISVKSSDDKIAKASISGTTITLMPGTKEGKATITVTSAETDNYKACSVTYTVTVKKGTLNVTATDYTGTYDGKAHSISVNCNGATITYSKDKDVEYSTENPTYTKGGVYTVYYKVEKPGYNTVTGSKKVIINRAEGSLTLSSSSGSLTFPTNGSISVSNNLSGGDISATSSDENVAKVSYNGSKISIISGTTAGTATITVTSAETANYTAASATYKVTVKNGTLNVTASGYEGTYDKNAHTITVTAPDGAKVSYSESKSGTYGTTAPSYANAGTYTVYYKVEKAGYTTVTGSKEVTINKAAGWITLSNTSGTITCPNNGSFTVKDSHGGALVVTTTNEKIATASVDKLAVTIIPGTTAGTATITVTSEATTNYEESSATYNVTVKNSGINVTTNGYTGIYDGIAHSITVTAPNDAIITYATSENGSYSSTKPYFTDAGSYTVYYKVTKAGAETVTGHEKVEISKAAGKVTLSATNGTVSAPDTLTFTVTNNIAGGTLSVTPENSNIATATVNGNTITVKPGTKTGTTVITIISAETKNHKKATATYTVINGNITSYALILDNSSDSSDSMPMIFVTSVKEIKVGDTYNSKSHGELTVIAVYSDFDAMIYNKEEIIPWYDYRFKITSVVFEGAIVAPFSTAYWFKSFKNCGYFDVEKLNTSNVTIMTSMFEDAGYNIPEPTIIGLTKWDVSNAENLNYMFYEFGYNSEIVILDFTNWDTTNITSMNSVFYGAGTKANTFKITGLDNWNTENVTDMNMLFSRTGYKASSWNIGDLSKWNLSKVANTNSMFRSAGYNAKTWNVGDLSNWDVSAVEDMGNMFYGIARKADSWDIGDISKWDTSNVENMTSMFAMAGTTRTTMLDLSKWDVSNVREHDSFFYLEQTMIIAPKWVF